MGIQGLGSKDKDNHLQGLGDTTAFPGSNEAVVIQQPRRTLDKTGKSSTITPPIDMEKLQGLIGNKEAATELHRRLEKWGGYERLEQYDPRRRKMLYTYFTTEKSAEDIGKEVGIGSRSRTTELLKSAMEIAFFALPEDQRVDYYNNPSIALQTRSKQQTQIKSDRVTEANLQRWEREREAQRAAQSENTGRNVSSTQFTTSGRRDVVAPTRSSDIQEYMRKIREAEQGEQAEEDQRSDQTQADPEGGNTPT